MSTHKPSIFSKLAILVVAILVGIFVLMTAGCDESQEMMTPLSEVTPAESHEDCELVEILDAYQVEPTVQDPLTTPCYEFTDLYEINSGNWVSPKNENPNEHPSGTFFPIGSSEDDATHVVVCLVSYYSKEERYEKIGHHWENLRPICEE